MQRMTRRIITTTGCRDWRVEISLPLIPALLDGKRYTLPGAPPPPADDRPAARPRVLQARPHRGPTSGSGLN